MSPRPATIFLRLALRRAARGSGSQRDFYMQRTAMQILPDLHTILAGISWALVGGIALRAYMPERMTLDVDIIVHERDTPIVQRAFMTAGYAIVAQLSIGRFTVRSLIDAQKPIDVLTRSDPWLDLALSSPTYDNAGYPVLGRPYLLLMKLQAGRTQDLADVQRLLALTPQNERQDIRDLVEQYSPDLVEDYDSLRTLADLEFGPPANDA